LNKAFCVKRFGASLSFKIFSKLEKKNEKEFERLGGCDVWYFIDGICTNAFTMGR
jgi:hypothetical protein